jgi:hypothetical protein
MTAPVERFREDDGQGRELVVYDRDDGKSAVQIEERRAGGVGVHGSWIANPLIAPDLCRAIFEGAGFLPPLMLGRPDLAAIRDAGGWVAFRGLRFRRAPGGGLTFAIGGKTETLSDPQARHLAAVAVAMADEGPDAGDLAATIRAGLPGDCEGAEDRGAVWEDVADAIASVLIERYRFTRREASDA